MIFLTLHALQRAEERGMTRDEIVEALAAEGRTTYTAEDGHSLVILGATKSGRRLKIITRADDMSYIITVADRGQEG